tara:strand:- start:2832 stop:3695 length:864 start_codon:yes stop_codon:yes gene_type:complete
MEDIVEALREGISIDLMPFSTYLFQKNIPHRIFEDKGCQVLVVSKDTDAQLVKRFYAAWRSGDLEMRENPNVRYRFNLEKLFNLRGQNPVCLSLIFLSCLGFICTYLLSSYEIVSWLTFLPFTFETGGIRYGFFEHQYWRIFSPSFLHFGWLHLVFNCLWLWELGGKIERSFGSLVLLAHFFFIAAISNLAQYLWTGPSLFGGMSGVVYGLLGFCWLESRINPVSSLRLPPVLIWFMLGWLFVCMTGLVEAVGFGAIANSAHVGGLLSGAFLGVVTGFWRRSDPTSQ